MIKFVVVICLVILLIISIYFIYIPKLTPVPTLVPIPVPTPVPTPVPNQRLLPTAISNAVMSELPSIGNCNNTCDNSKIDINFWFDGNNPLSATAKIKGNSTSMWDQKSYTIKLDKAVSLTELFTNLDKYVLYAPYFEINRIQNPLIFYLSNLIGMSAPQSTPVRLWVNKGGIPSDWNALANSTLPSQSCGDGNDSPYRGLYWLLSPIDQDMLNLTKNDFLIQFDRGNCPDDESSIITNYLPWGFDVSKNAVYSTWSRPLLSYPDPEKSNGFQNKEIAGNILTDFVNKLFGPLVGSDKEPSQDALDMIDIESWAKYFILSEFASSVDGYSFSTYLNIRKEKNGNYKVYMGPIWDYNEAFGSCYNYGLCRDGGNSQFWRYTKQWFVFEPKVWRFGIPQLYARLLMSSSFRKQLFQIYKDLRKSDLSNKNILKISNYFTNLIKPEIPFIEKRWPTRFNWNHYNPSNPTAIFNWSTNILNNWIVKRLEWMDINMVDGPPIDPITGNNGYMLSFNKPTTSIQSCSKGDDQYYMGCDRQNQLGLFYSKWPSLP